MLELRAARPLVAWQEKVSVELAVEVLGPEASAVGHWDTTVATAGVHRGAHLTAGSISFNTNKHTEHTGLGMMSHFPEVMHCCTLEKESHDRKSELWSCCQGINRSERIHSNSSADFANVSSSIRKS